MWRMALGVARYVPRGLLLALARVCAVIYRILAPHRVRVVRENVSPALPRDEMAAGVARKLFREFATKLVDLWRYEAGVNIDDLLGEAIGWEHFEKARAEGRGVLIVTPHLGNWEFGDAFLLRQGMQLQVVTQAEPGQDFTKLRQRARASRNVRTLVVGEDPFGFLEVIKRLEAGDAVALLLDRPPGGSTVNVTLFGRQTKASLAAAELARASGCVLLPVYVPYVNGRYHARVLPPVEYDRASLRDRAVSQQLTQRIISAFEPVIREHIAQWYHFVPIWNASQENGGRTEPLLGRPGAQQPSA